MDLYLTGILLAYGVFAVGMFSPGPNILSLVGTSMGAGRSAGAALSFGISTGSILWALLTWGGLTAVLTLYASVLTAIKIAGALYLLWLAYKAFRSAASERPLAVSASENGGSNWRYFRRGLLIQMTNPKAALTWVAIMSFGLQEGAPLWVGGSIVAGTAVLAYLSHLAYAMLFSTAPVVAAYRKARRWIEAGLGTFFCAASYKLLTSKTP